MMSNGFLYVPIVIRFLSSLDDFFFFFFNAYLPMLGLSCSAWNL